MHHKVQEFSSGTGLPGWSRKKGRKMDVCMCVKCHCDVAVSYYGAYAVQIEELCKLPSSSNLVQFAKASPSFLRPWFHHLARLNTTSVLTSPDRLLALKIRYHISSNRSPPASVSTITSDPRPVFEARPVFKAGLVLEHPHYDELTVTLCISQKQKHVC